MASSGFVKVKIDYRHYVGWLTANGYKLKESTQSPEIKTKIMAMLADQPRPIGQYNVDSTALQSSLEFNSDNVRGSYIESERDGDTFYSTQRGHQKRISHGYIKNGILTVDPYSISKNGKEYHYAEYNFQSNYSDLIQRDTGDRWNEVIDIIIEAVGLKK